MFSVMSKLSDELIEANLSLTQNKYPNFNVNPVTPDLQFLCLQYQDYKILDRL